MAPAIPDRWIPYKACGNVIEGTRFICFKVPLRITVQKDCPGITEIWDIKTLLETIPNLGAVIDLTNTARYYSPKELEDAGVSYKKIFLPGRIIPPKNIVSQFMNAVDDFLEKDCDSLIGVHCTHGLNRTGYMVCRYMRDRLGVDPEEAIKKFEKARGYKIERDNYLADLLGHTPPPPFDGAHTNIKPVDICDFSQDVDVCNEFLENDSTSDWREHTPGKYVIHPDFHKKRKRKLIEDGSNDDFNGKAEKKIKKRNNSSTEKDASAVGDSNYFYENGKQQRRGDNNYGNYKRSSRENYDNRADRSNKYRNYNATGHGIKREEFAADESNANYENLGNENQGNMTYEKHESDSGNNYRGRNGRYGYDNTRHRSNTYENNGEQGGDYGNYGRQGRGRERDWHKNGWNDSTQNYQRPYNTYENYGEQGGDYGNYGRQGRGRERGWHNNGWNDSTQNYQRPYDHRYDY